MRYLLFAVLVAAGCQYQPAYPSRPRVVRWADPLTIKTPGLSKEAGFDLALPFLVQEGFAAETKERASGVIQTDKRITAMNYRQPRYFAVGVVVGEGTVTITPTVRCTHFECNERHLLPLEADLIDDLAAKYKPAADGGT